MSIDEGKKYMSAEDRIDHIDRMDSWGIMGSVVVFGLGSLEMVDVRVIVDELETISTSLSSFTLTWYTDGIVGLDDLAGDVGLLWSGGGHVVESIALPNSSDCCSTNAARG